MYEYESELKKLDRPIPDVLHFIFLIAFGVSLFTLVLASLSPAEAIRPYVRHSDKLVHFCAYFGVSFIALGAFPKMHPILIFLGLSLTGVAVELLQGSMGLGRTASAGDIVANCLGCATPILLWTALRLLLPSKHS